MDYSQLAQMANQQMMAQKPSINPSQQQMMAAKQAVAPQGMLGQAQAAPVQAVPQAAQNVAPQGGLLNNLNQAGMAQLVAQHPAFAQPNQLMGNQQQQFQNASSQPLMANPKQAAYNFLQQKQAQPMMANPQQSYAAKPVQNPAPNNASNLLNATNKNTQNMFNSVS